MRRIPAFAFCLILSVSMVIQAQDVLFFFGDLNGTENNPAVVALDDTVDIPVYFQALNSSVVGASYNCPIGINNQYSDTLFTDRCYFDPGGTIGNWDLAAFDNYNEDVPQIQDMHGTISTWDSYSAFGIIETGLPYDNEPFTSLVPELQLHFSIHIINDISIRRDTTCLVVGTGWDPFGAYPAMSDTLGVLIYDVLIDKACYRFTGGQGLTGVVTNEFGEPFEGIIVSIDSGGLVDTTDYEGKYSFTGVSGSLDVSFFYPGYLELTRNKNVSPTGVSYLDIEMCAIEFDDDVDIMTWAGGGLNGCSWYDTIQASPGQWIEIPVYALGIYDSVEVGSIDYPLGINNAYIDSFDVNFEQTYYPISNWDLTFYGYLNEDYFTDTLGNTWDSYTFIGLYDSEEPWGDPTLAFENGTSPIHLFDFRIHVREDLSFDSTIIISDAIAEGYNDLSGYADMTNPPGTTVWELSLSYSKLKITSGYRYVPGDVNMAVGQWPPHPGLSDITYLVNYFRGWSTSVPCYYDGLWVSADTNGDCLVIGSDVTYLVGCFRGLRSINHCPNYEPSWPSEDAAPTVMPSGWPNCDE